MLTNLLNLFPPDVDNTLVSEPLNTSLKDIKHLAELYDDWAQVSCNTHTAHIQCISNQIPLQFGKIGEDFYLKAMSWQTLVEACPSSSNNKSHPQYWAETDMGFVCRELCVITKCSPWVVLTFDVLLMMKDIVFGNWLVHAYSVFDPRHSNLSTDLQFIHSWGAGVLERYGNMGYEIIKGIEPLSTCRLIELSETLLDASEQTRTMTNKYKKKEESFLGTETQVLILYEVDKLMVFLSTLIDPNRIAQIFSMMKMCGHPYTSPIEGCEAKRLMSLSKSTATYTGIKNVEWSFCHMFITGYINKMKHWPPMAFRLKEGVPTKLQLLHDSDHQPLPMGLTIYDPSDWDFATLLPIDEFDYGEDLLSLVVDKSLSYKRSEINNSWKGHLDFKPKKPTSSKRVIVEALKADMTIKDVCAMVEADNIPADWYVVSVHPKEREMKWLSRLFCMMVFWMRCFFNNLEVNIAKKIFTYIPHQTMTMNAKEEEETFLRITKQSIDQHMLSISIDLSAWNTHFTKEMSDPLGARFNQLLGVTNLFTFIHTFYSRCLFVLRHPSFEPHGIPKTGDPPLQPGIWDKDGRGNEGIGQKFWTCYTLAMLHWVIWRFGVRYTITCQGDNLVLYIPTSRKPDEEFVQYQQRIRSLSREIVIAIERAATEVGHEVKAEECSQSTSFCTYGKNMWFKGTKLESTFKVVSRMFPQPDSDLPTTHSMIGTLSAQGSSMTDRSTNSIWCFFYTKFLENWLIRRELRSSVLHGLPKEWELLRTVAQNSGGGLCLLLTLIPSNLGGYPVSCLAEFLYRGHSDPLSSSFGSLSPFLAHPLINRYIRFLKSSHPYRKADSLEIDRLIESPFDIPLSTPPIPGSSLTKLSFEEAMKITTNIHFKEMFNMSCSMKNSKRNIFHVLSSMRPFYPAIAHEIYKCSIPGTIFSMIKSIYSTKTISAIANSSDAHILKRLKKEDLRWFQLTGEFLLKSYTISSGVLLSGSDLYDVMVYARGQWGIDQLTGVSNCHPLMNFDAAVVGCEAGNELALKWANGTDCIISVVSLKNSALSSTMTRGPVQPYLGDYTEEKAVAKWAKPVNTTKPLLDVIRLLQIGKMISAPGTSMRLYIESLVCQRSSLPLEFLYEFARDKFGGTTGHRFTISDAVRGSFSSTISTWASNMSVSTNLLREASLLDYPLSIHEFVLSLITFSNWFLGASGFQAPFGLVYRIHTHNLPTVEDSLVTLTHKSIELPPPLQLTHGHYYLRADNLTLSKSSRPINRISGSIAIDQKDPSIEDALFQVYLSAATGTSHIVPCGKLVRSTPILSSLVDLPEVYRLSFSNHVDTLVRAVLASVSVTCILAVYKGQSFHEQLSERALSSALIICPQVFGTFKKCNNITEPLLSASLGEAAVRDSSIRLSLFIHQRVGQLLATPEDILVPVIFEKGVTVLSSDLLNRLSLLCLKYCLMREVSLPSAKLILKIALKLKKLPTEMDRVLGIVELIKTCGFQNYVHRSDTAPQLVLRELRQLPSQPSITPAHVCSSTLAPLRGCCLGTGRELDFTALVPVMSPRDLVESWSLRPYPGISDANHRWNPVSALIDPGDSVLVLGIGAGGILQCIPTTCMVFGIELPSALTSCGQDYTTYKPAFQHPNYRTLPTSWVHAFDVTNEVGRKGLSRQVACYDVVLVDIEGVDTLSRLKLRLAIAEQGPRCWVRCYDTKDIVKDIHQSACSLRKETDFTWSPSILMGLEIIVGCSDSPLGLFKATGQCTPQSISPCSHPSHEDSKAIARRTSLFQLGHNPLSTTTEMHDILYRAQHGRTESYFSSLMRFQTGDYTPLQELGRCKLRSVEFLLRV
jgi:hypothetical protein